ncbi:head-tail connector protein [Bacillus seohaeanensis]|uniref:Head-tail connector protein n=1 Tax=Bacillus seohaeanensis TaxID=284580 RepID=A0ABW5RT05_9BACI
MLNEVKQYLRIEEDWVEEDTQLNSLITAAKAYIKNATGVKVDELNDLHKLAVCMLVVHWYENREIVGKADSLAFSLESIIFQIQFTGGQEV